MDIERLCIDWKGLKKLGFPFSRAHTQRLEDDKKFPERVNLGARRVVWPYGPVLEWFAKHGLTPRT